jgi:hypothetical protein
MATAQTSIFNGALSGAAINLSSQFDNAIGFYLIAPGASVEYQIDIFLQVQLTNTTTRMVRLDPSNVSNTERITLLPASIVELGLPMRLAIVPSESFNLEVILLQSDCGVCQLNQRIEALEQTVADLENELTNDNQLLETALNLILNYLGIPVPVLPAAMSATSQSNYFNTGFI